jgi:hypothetical protein
VSTRLFIVTLALATLLGGVSVAAPAQRATESKDNSASQSTQLTLQQAVRQVQRQTHGRILTADTIPHGNSKVFRIKVLTPKGHVRVVQMRSDDDKSRQGHERRGGH